MNDCIIRVYSILLFFVAAGASAGCGGGGPKYETAPLKGTVTINGQPVEQGRLQFVPQTGTPGQAVSAEIKQGQYEAEVPLGTLQVMFSITRETGVMNTERGYAEVENIVPPAFRQGVEIQVAGDKTEDFHLK